MNDAHFLVSTIVQTTVVISVMSSTVLPVLPDKGEQTNFIEKALSKVDYSEEISAETLGHNSFNSVSKTLSLDKLDNIQRLKDDWNGYGAKPIPIGVVDLCRNIVMELENQPEILPTARRSVQMEYRLKDRSYLEIEVFEDYIATLEVPQRIYSEAKESRISAKDYRLLSSIVLNFHGGVGEWKYPRIA